MLRRVFVDCEFTNPPWTPKSEMLWVGLADDAGNSWSAINVDAAIDERSSEFTRAVITPLMTPDELRLTRDQVADGIRAFCGATVDEFWAWCPTAEQLAGPPFDLGADAARIHADCWNWDLQLIRRLVDPSPAGWPTTLNDIQALTLRAGTKAPLNPGAHHPRADAEHNRMVYDLAVRAVPDLER